MTVRIAVFENSFFINVQASRASRINMGIFFTNRKSLSIHSASVPRSQKSKECQKPLYSATRKSKKETSCQNLNRLKSKVFAKGKLTLA